MITADENSILEEFGVLHYRILQIKPKKVSLALVLLLKEEAFLLS